MLKGLCHKQWFGLEEDDEERTSATIIALREGALTFHLPVKALFYFRPSPREGQPTLRPSGTGVLNLRLRVRAREMSTRRG
jgi:hypothetical protein